MDLARNILSKFKVMDVDIERSLLEWTEHGEEHFRGLVALMRPKDMSMRKLFAIFGLVVAQQMLGMTALLFYMEKIFSLTCKYLEIISYWFFI